MRLRLAQFLHEKGSDSSSRPEPFVRIALLTLACLTCIAPAAVEARPAWTSGTYVYADLCTAPGGGIEGYRVVVRRSPNGDLVTFQQSNGGPAAPLPASALAIDDGARAITFTIEGPHGPQVFRGSLAPDMLAGTISDETGERVLQLRRALRSHASETCPAPIESVDTAAAH